MLGTEFLSAINDCFSEGRVLKATRSVTMDVESVTEGNTIPSLQSGIAQKIGTIFHISVYSPLPYFHRNNDR
jgi:hypothetical protein